MSTQPNHPSTMQTTLAILRKYASADDSDEFKAFMVSTAELPGECVVSLCGESIRLLVDDEAHALAFSQNSQNSI